MRAFRHAVTAIVAALVAATVAVPAAEGATLSPNNAISGAQVVGGVAATPSATRFFATVQATPDVICGGSVIGARWILTAAHCVVGLKWRRSGAAYVNPSSFNAGTFRASGSAPVRWDRVIVHPEVSERPLQNDVALIHTVEPMTAVTIPFVDAGQSPTQGEQLRVDGFGLTSENGSLSQKLLSTTVIDLLGPSPAACGDFDRDSDPDTSYNAVTMLCAGTPDGSRDACNGDSGGPLTTVGQTPRLVGIVSWGTGCARAEYPGIYARVSTYSNWITATTGIAANTPSAVSVGPGYLVASRSCRTESRCRTGRGLAVYLGNTGGTAARWRAVTRGIKLTPKHGSVTPGQTANLALTLDRAKCGSYRILQGRRLVMSGTISARGSRC